MAVILNFQDLVINFEGEKTPPITLEIKEGERVGIVLSREYYERAFLHFLHLLVEDYEGSARFCNKEFSDFDRELEVKWLKSFISVSLTFPLISNLKVIENVYLPLLYRENVKEEEAFSKAYQILKELGIEGRYNALPSILTTFEKKLVLLARAIMAEPKIIYYGNVLSDMDEEKRHFFIEKMVKYHSGDGEKIAIVTMRTERELMFLEPFGINKVIEY